MYTFLLNGEPYIEVRRLPYGRQDGSPTILKKGSCHLRLVNRYLYDSCPVDHLIKFIKSFNIEFVSITRLDVCLDFQRFDTGELPIDFVKKYVFEKIEKIHGGKIFGNVELKVNGNQQWDVRYWNSFGWGGKKCPVKTRLYDKTLELSQVSRKPWIYDAWRAAGIDYEQSPVWRLEFAVSSRARWSFDNDTGELSELTLSSVRSRDDILKLFHSLVKHFFVFKDRNINKKGKFVEGLRKYDCRDHITFVSSTPQKPYKPFALTQNEKPSKTVHSLLKQLHSWASLPQYADSVKSASKHLIRFIQSNQREFLTPLEIANLEAELGLPIFSDPNFLFDFDKSRPVEPFVDTSLLVSPWSVIESEGDYSISIANYNSLVKRGQYVDLLDVHSPSWDNLTEPEENLIEKKQQDKKGGTVVPPTDYVDISPSD